MKPAQAAAPWCGHCVDRPAIAIDPDTMVPICAQCRDGEVPEPQPFNPMDRVLRHVHRFPGCVVAEIAEAMDITDTLARYSLTQMLSRACAQGLARADGPKNTRRYYVDELRSAHQPRRCFVCRDELTSNNSVPKVNGIGRLCTSCKTQRSNDDADTAATRAQA